MANHESKIKSAIENGDQAKVNKAYADYCANMRDHKQNPKPLSYFTK